MHLYEKTNKTDKKLLLSAAAFILIASLLLFGINKTSRIVKQEEAQLLYNAIDKAIVSCYAIEGRYPESLHYIVDNYGIIINEDRFLVSYEAFAANVKPSLRVAVKGEVHE